MATIALLALAFRIDQLPEMRFEAFVRAFLIHAHQPRVTRHIGGEDRSETADRRHFWPGDRLSNRAYPEIGSGPSVQWVGAASSAASGGMLPYQAITSARAGRAAARFPGVNGCFGSGFDRHPGRLPRGAISVSPQIRSGQRPRERKSPMPVPRRPGQRCWS